LVGWFRLLQQLVYHSIWRGFMAMSGSWMRSLSANHAFQRALAAPHD